MKNKLLFEFLIGKPGKSRLIALYSSHRIACIKRALAYHLSHGIMRLACENLNNVTHLLLSILTPHHRRLLIFSTSNFYYSYVVKIKECITERGKKAPTICSVSYLMFAYVNSSISAAE